VSAGLGDPSGSLVHRALRLLGSHGDDDQEERQAGKTRTRDERVGNRVREHGGRHLTRLAQRAAEHRHENGDAQRGPDLLHGLHGARRGTRVLGPHPGEHHGAQWHVKQAASQAEKHQGRGQRRQVLRG